MEVYHGSNSIVEFPEVRKSKYTKDFSWGFYCTLLEEQAQRWARRFLGSKVVSIYKVKDIDNLNYKKFEATDSEWLDFIAKCRSGGVHDYDIVEGPMADDQVYDYVDQYLSGDITKEDFMILCKFKKPTHQISFHTLKALDKLVFERSYNL